jgi:hypothetical protein
MTAKTAKETMTAQDFTFTHKGKKHSIPAFAALPMGALRKARKAEDEGDKVFTILENVLSETDPALAAIDSMTATEFAAFLEEWTQGVAVGESSGSGS